MLKILFLCTGNSCRSQMAEVLAKQLYPTHKFYSAGTKPKNIDSYAIKVIEELGLNMSQYISKNIKSLKAINFDVVITVCDNASELCPIFPGKILRVHHSFQDPPRLVANLTNDYEKLAIYREIRDDIKKYLANSLPNLVKGLK